jgi:hypothetical protein
MRATDRLQKKVVARCGSCHATFRAEFRAASRLPPQCPLCFRAGSYWVDEHGVPLGGGGSVELCERGHREPVDSIADARDRKTRHTVFVSRRKRPSEDS